MTKTKKKNYIIVITNLLKYFNLYKNVSLYIVKNNNCLKNTFLQNIRERQICSYLAN